MRSLVLEYLSCAVYSLASLDLQNDALALLVLPLPVLGALLALLDLAHQDRVYVFDVLARLGRRLDVQTVPLGCLGRRLLVVHLAQLAQIGLVTDKNEGDLE